jgi:hypothetical protein
MTMETHPENTNEEKDMSSPYPSPPDVEMSADVDLSPQLLEELRAQDKSACRRTFVLILVILFVGLCMIIAIVTLRFTQNSSSTNLEALTLNPDTFNPTSAPSAYVSTDYPTFIPTTLRPTFPPVPPLPTRFPTKMIFPTKKPSVSNAVGSRGPTMRVSLGGIPTKPLVNTAKPTSVEYAIIRNVALEGGAEFLRPNSYQSKALRWLEQSSWVSSSGMQMIQRYTLACISFATTNITHKHAYPARPKMEECD